MKIEITDYERKRVNLIMEQIRTGEIDLNTVERIEWYEEDPELGEALLNIRILMNHALTQKVKGTPLPTEAIAPAIRKWLDVARKDLGVEPIEGEAEA